MTGTRIRTKIVDRNDAVNTNGETREVIIPIGHTATVGANISECDSGVQLFEIEWDDIDGKPAGWTIWSTEEITCNAEIL